MKRIIVILLLLIGDSFSSEVQAQRTEKDSLQILLRFKDKNDTIKVNLLNEKAIKAYSNNIDESLQLSQQALTLSEELNFTKGKALSLRLIGNVNFYKSDFSTALEYYNKSLRIYDDLENKKGIALCYNNIGDIFKTEGNFTMALEYYKKALIISEEIKDKKTVSYCYLNIGNIYINLSDYTKAMDYLIIALIKSKEIGDKRGTSTILNSFGVVYELRGEYLKSLEYYKNSLKLNKELNDILGEAYSNLNIAIIYISLEKYSKALEYFQEVIKLNRNIGDKEVEASLNTGLGEIYFNQDNPFQAYRYGKIAYKIANEIERPSLIKESSELLSKSSEALGYFKEAYTYQSVFKAMNDSLNNLENIKKTTALEFQHKFEKEKQQANLEKRKQNAINAQNIRRQKMVRNSFIAGFILLLIIVFILLRNFLQKRKANIILTKQKQEIQAQAQELDKKNSKLKDLNATKDKFFSIISHDLKNPFNTLLGISNLLLENDQDYSEKQRREYIQYINDSSSKTYKLLENLLVWSKSQTGLINYMPERIHLKTLVSQMVLLFKETTEFKNIETVVTISNSMFVIADKNMLDTIFRNLISNAIKFTPKGGEICISAESKFTDEGQLYTKIKVTDTGIGISKKKQAKLFDISENIVTKGTDNEMSIGLGLILCKEFVEKQGGNIWVKSKKGKGTTIYFTIPNNSMLVENDNEIIKGKQFQNPKEGLINI